MKFYLKGVDESVTKLCSIKPRHSQVKIDYYEQIIERYNQVDFQQLQVKHLPAAKFTLTTHI